MVQVTKGSGRNRTGVCEGVPRRRSYVRRTAAPPNENGTSEGGHMLRPSRSRPMTVPKRKYVRKNNGLAEQTGEDMDNPSNGEEVDYLFGCTKCRYLKAGCSSCQHKPIMERSRRLRWDPSKARPQKVRSCPLPAMCKQ